MNDLHSQDARRGGGVTSMRIILRDVLQGALKNATSSRKGDWGHAIRVMVVLAGLGYGGSGLYHGTPDRNDFKSAYPAYGQLETASGMLVEERTRRTSYFVLEVTDKPNTPAFRDYRLVTDKPVLPIITNHTLKNPLRDMGWEEEGAPITPHFVSIKYFRLPSSRAWVAELKYGGETLINYEQRKADFSVYHEIRRDLDRGSFIALFLSVAAIIWIVVEAYIQLKRENQNGNQ